MDNLEYMKRKASGGRPSFETEIDSEVLQWAVDEIERLRAEVALWKDRYEAADRDMKAMVADYEDYLNGLKHK